jgi:ribosomal protein L37AE/L43A
VIKIYICPKCGWLREVSRRKEVECFKCNGEKMQLSKLSYEKYIMMDKDARDDYSQSWLYIHRKEQS